MQPSPTVAQSSLMTTPLTDPPKEVSTNFMQDETIGLLLSSQEH